MDKPTLLSYLAAMDEHLLGDAELFIYGSAAFILLDEADRTSLDVDVAAPYSKVSFPDLSQAAAKAGLPINPDESTQQDHLEWVPPGRLCLAAPTPATEVLLWQGRRLTVKTLSPARLVASKLIRYDTLDQSDIRFLCFQAALDHETICQAADELPEPFRDDPVLRENLANLKIDLDLWRESS